MDVTVDLNRGTALVGETNAPGVSWGAIAAGAAAAAALLLLLVALGAGLGLSWVSPWGGNPSATGFSIAAAIWLTLSQLISAGVGGYLAGRLRTRWNAVHTDEVFFRDTAHGLAVWAVGVIVGASLLTAAAATVVTTGATTAAVGAAVASDRDDASSYFVDMLFRNNKPEIVVTRPLPTAEVSRILVVSLANGAMTPADKNHLAQLVAARTDLTQTEAEQRIDDVINQAKAAADKARKAAAAAAIWTAISLLVGAFAASWMATFGGRLRDRV